MASNPIIEAQRQLLESLDNPIDEGTVGTPPSDPPQSVPGQEPSSQDGHGAGAQPPALPPNEPAPQAGTADTEALKQQIAVLTGQVEEYKSLYNRQHGMVAPLQRKVAEQERTIADLNRKVQEASTSATPAPQQPTQGKPTEAPPQASDEDPAIKEFVDLYGDMIPGLKALIHKTVGAAVKPFQPTLDQLEAQQREQTEKTERETFLREHLKPLYTRYPKAGDILRSPEFAEWVEKHPSWQKDAMVDRVLHPENYPVEQIISVFDDYSRNTNTTSTPSPGEMAVDPRRIPTSATPGGRPEPQPLTPERLAKIRRALTVERSLYTTEQIAAFKAELEQGEVASNSAGYGLAPRLDTLTR